MSNEKDIGFVQQLAEATNTGKVSWQPTARIDEFTISFKGRFSLIIARPSQGYFVFRMLDEGDREMLKLEYLEEDPGFGELPVKSLYEAARRQALQVDDAIDGILQELEKK